MTARVRLPDSLAILLRSEMERAIYESNLGDEDTLIAKRYLIQHIPQIDIAAEFGCERSTVSRRLKAILARVEYTAGKICKR